MRTFFCAVLLCLHVAANASSESTEMKRAIDTMQEVYHVSFVYDSALADVMPAGRPLPDKTLTENLNIVLGGTGIKWEIKDEYVLLFNERPQFEAGQGEAVVLGESKVHAHINNVKKYAGIGKELAIDTKSARISLTFDNPDGAELLAGEAPGIPALTVIYINKASTSATTLL